MMSCLLIVSWVIEVEYTLTAIPQLQKKEKRTEKYFWVDRKVLISRYTEFRIRIQRKKEKLYHSRTFPPLSRKVSFYAVIT